MVPFGVVAVDGVVEAGVGVAVELGEPIDVIGGGGDLLAERVVVVPGAAGCRVTHVAGAVRVLTDAVSGEVLLQIVHEQLLARMVPSTS